MLLEILTTIRLPLRLLLLCRRLLLGRLLLGRLLLGGLLLRLPAARGRLLLRLLLAVAAPVFSPGGRLRLLRSRRRLRCTRRLLLLRAAAWTRPVLRRA
ncbi:MAG TPA: hypothetical protein VEQ16_02195 [Acidocella sp.]|nr:hypothetical protein [Acidocella sp.]